MNFRFLASFLIFLSIDLLADDFIVAGIYQGKNIYIQNPISADLKHHCINHVYINNVKVVNNLETSAFEIDLSALKINDPVTIKIEHKNECVPKILNQHVIMSDGGFSFSGINIEGEFLTWVTRGEKTNELFFLEHFMHDQWETEKEIKGKNNGLINSYTVQTKQYAGENRYRIRHQSLDGGEHYSPVVQHTSTLPPVTFFPKRISDTITLSRKAEYRIKDKDDNTVLQGHGDHIVMTEKNSGFYFLYIENNTYKIFKK